MHDAGCVLGCFVAIILPALLYVILRIRGDSAAEARRRETLSAAAATDLADRRSRATKITDLLLSIPPAVGTDDLARQVGDLLQAKPVGYLPELTQPRGWFEQVAPILRSLTLRNDVTAEVVGHYFRCFSFPSGKQQAVLTWLDQSLDIVADARRERIFKQISTCVLSESSLDEADWLYRRALESVRSSRGDSRFKSIALHIGRLRYAAARPDRQATFYDEQAIANDIAVSI